MMPSRPAGGKATIVELDMADYAATPRLAAAIHGRWGRLDGLLANAAMLGPLTPLSHLDDKIWDSTISVNLTAQWHLIRAMEPLLIAAPAGRAVLVSSGVCRGDCTFLGAICDFQGWARGNGAGLGWGNRTN